MSHPLIIPRFEVIKLLPASLTREAQSLPSNVVESITDDLMPGSDPHNSRLSPICSDEVWLTKLLHWVETTRLTERNQMNEAEH